uniref:DUF6577 family protein n=1 Tax=Lachnospira eligens TaxID=39485 RepID=UPI0040288F50
MQWIQFLENTRNFNRTDIMNAFEASGEKLSTPLFKKKLQQMLDSGTIARIGRNAYCIPENGEKPYSYQYSDLANDVAEVISEAHPLLMFSISELIQVNEFTNHQIAHNIIFLSVEDDVADFVFDTLKEKYPGKVLLNPSVELFHQYWYDNMIVIGKLITEAPKGKLKPWHARIEKILVDIMNEPLWQESISESELPTIFEDAFERYTIDESCLFRYAQRRTAEKRLRTFISDQTTVNLRTKR